MVLWWLSLAGKVNFSFTQNIILCTFNCGQSWGYKKWKVTSLLPSVRQKMVIVSKNGAGTSFSCMQGNWAKIDFHMVCLYIGKTYFKLSRLAYFPMLFFYSWDTLSQWFTHQDPCIFQVSAQMLPPFCSFPTYPTQAWWLLHLYAHGIESFISVLSH